MVLEEESKLVKSPNAFTQYLTIPATMVRDSQYPFRNGGNVKVMVDPEKRRPIVMKAEEE